MKKILIGSAYFFSIFKDFFPKDKDYILLEDNLYKNKIRLTNGKEDIFIVKKKSKEELINDVLHENDPITIGKFLIPEFCNLINFTIDDLLVFKELIQKIDKLHEYEIIIFNSYIKNNNFILTKEQLADAYISYRKYR